jgi:hypothetical protein
MSATVIPVLLYHSVSDGPPGSSWGERLRTRAYRTARRQRRRLLGTRNARNAPC